MKPSHIPGLFVGLALATPALGSEPQQHVDYRFEHEVRVSPEVIGFEPVAVGGSLAVRWRIDTSCEVQPVQSGRDLTCTVRGVRLGSDASPLAAIGRARTELEQAVVEARLGPDGRLNAVDVRLADQSPSPLARFVVERSFAGLDLPVGDDSIWEQRSTRLVPEPGAQGAVAHVRALHWIARDADQPLVATHARVSWMPRATVVEPGSTMQGEVKAVAVLDPELGLVRERRWTTEIGEGGFAEKGSVKRMLRASS